MDWIAPEEVLLASRWDDVALAPANDDGYLDVDLFDIILDDDDGTGAICNVSVAGDSARSRERGAEKEARTGDARDADSASRFARIPRLARKPE